MDAVHSYRKCVQSSDSDSSDSDSECFWKRSKPSQEITPIASALPITEQSKKVNNVWGAVLQEQKVSDSLCGLGLKKKPITLQDRRSESYDFRQKLYDSREDEAVDDEDMDTSNKMEAVVDAKKKARRNIRLNKADLDVARKITWRLNERKKYLISRVVHFLGARKAMELLDLTEETEDNGGMQIKNNTRRRTPGGVYFQHLKNDKEITKMQIEDIFRFEESFEERKLRKKKKKRKTKKQNSENGKMDTSQSPIAKEEATNRVATTATTPESCVASALDKTEIEFNKDSELEFKKDSELEFKKDSEVEEGEVTD